MENYADYEFYISEYNGSLSSDLFDTFIVKASRDIDRNVNCELTTARINMLSDRDKYRLQYTACELCDYYNTYESADGENKVNSMSIDGVSISQNNNSENARIQEKKKIYNNLPHELTRYL